MKYGENEIALGCCCRLAQLRTVADAGFEYAELSAAELAEMTDEEFEAAVERISECGISIPALNDLCGSLPAVAGKNFSAAAAKEYALLVTRRAHRIGVRCIGVGAPQARILPFGYSLTEAENQAVEFLRVFSDAASEYPGMSILLEALNSTVCNFCNTQAQALDIVHRVGRENVLMEADFFHILMMGESFCQFSDRAQYTGHVHISGRDEAGYRRLFVRGEEPLCESMAAAIVSGGYSGGVSVEAPAASLEPGALKTTLSIMKNSFYLAEGRYV